MCYKKGTQDMLTSKVLKHQLLSSAALTQKKNVKGEGLILGGWQVDHHVHLRVP